MFELSKLMHERASGTSELAVVSLRLGSCGRKLIRSETKKVPNGYAPCHRSGAMLMAVQALGYLGISTQDIDGWSDFATRQVGLEVVDRTASSRAFRMDDRRQRIIVDREHPDSERFFGGRLLAPRALMRLQQNSMRLA